MPTCPHEEDVKPVLDYRFVAPKCGKGKVQKKREKNLTSVSVMYVCVAGIGEMLVFFLLFFPQQ